jgi:predicted NBD/HSP70 family sugar kinase
MKITIKVGDAQIEIEGEKLKVAKVTSSGTPVEVKESKTAEEALEECLAKMTAAFREQFKDLIPNS